ncbi:MAG: hypothetical protein AAFX78_02240 [Cyanobacteria bacterium J06638_20]
MTTSQGFRATESRASLLGCRGSRASILAFAFGAGLLFGAIVGAMVGVLAASSRPLQAQTLPPATGVNEANPIPAVAPTSESSLPEDDSCQIVERSGARACRVQPASDEPSSPSPSSVGQATLPFSDVPLDHWAYDALLFLSAP